jgi:hypothetical protein
VSRPEPGDSLRAVLLSLPDRLDVGRVDELWIFPTRELAGGESGLIVVSLLPVDPVPPDHRQLLTVEYERERGRPRAAPSVEVTEQGWAPHDRLTRVVSGVTTRLAEERDPVLHSLHGDPEAWTALLREHGAAVIDRPNGE